MVAASVAPIRQPWPGTQMARGVKGRKRIVAYFSEQIPIRRGKEAARTCSRSYAAPPTRTARCCRPQDIVDHMSFLMMAAHDTLTSSLTSFVGALAANPHWQERLREEVTALGVAANEPTSFDNLEAMPLSEMAFKEAMRHEAAGALDPAPRDPRFQLQGLSRFRPAPWSASIRCSPITCRRSGPIPRRFDPMRFTDEAQRNRHRFAWVPFGGGAHMCLGLHFAYMQAKCFARHFLQNLSVSLEPGYTPDWQMWPIPKPRDGLRVTLKAVEEATPMSVILRA